MTGSRATGVSIVLFRAMIVVFVIAYVWLYNRYEHFPSLSQEASQYRADALAVMGGLDNRFGFARLCFWVAQAIVGPLGVLLMFFRRRSGVIVFALFAPLVLAGVRLNAFEAAWPDLMETSVVLLISSVSALWGGVLVLAVLQRRELFVVRAGGTASGRTPLNGNRQ